MMFVYQPNFLNPDEMIEEVDLNELQHLMSGMAQQMLSAYQVRAYIHIYSMYMDASSLAFLNCFFTKIDVAQKLKQKEETLLNRISKLEKSV